MSTFQHVVVDLGWTALGWYLAWHGHAIRRIVRRRRRLELIRAQHEARPKVRR